jgi:hypothetical protein
MEQQTDGWQILMQKKTRPVAQRLFDTVLVCSFPRHEDLIHGALDSGAPGRGFPTNAPPHDFVRVGLPAKANPAQPTVKGLSRINSSRLPLLSIAKVNLLRFLDISLSRYEFNFSF